MLTHPDPRSLGACWVLVATLEALLDGASPADAWRSALDEVDGAKLDQPIQARFGPQRGALIRERLPEARAAIRDAVECGLTGQWRSQSGYVIDTLEAAVAASLAPSFLDGILPIVARGDDSDTVAAIAGAAPGRAWPAPARRSGGRAALSLPLANLAARRDRWLADAGGVRAAPLGSRGAVAGRLRPRGGGDRLRHADPALVHLGRDRARRPRWPGAALSARRLAAARCMGSPTSWTCARRTSGTGRGVEAAPPSPRSTRLGWRGSRSRSET